MAFTLFMAYVHSSSELAKWRVDTDKNGRTVTILRRNPAGEITKSQIKRGELRAGDVIEVVKKKQKKQKAQERKKRKEKKKKKKKKKKRKKEQREYVFARISRGRYHKTSN
jgi:sRNA-binding protein